MNSLRITDEDVNNLAPPVNLYLFFYSLRIVWFKFRKHVNVLIYVPSTFAMLIIIV